jgi:hypothetical protein
MSGEAKVVFVTWEIILRDFWGAVLRDCTNVLTSAVSAFAQIPVPEALAIAGSADEHQRLHLDQSGRFWIEAWTDYVGDQPRAEWLSHEEAARWYATAHWDDWRCGLSDAPQELSGLVREIGNHRVLSAYTAHGAVSCTASS